METSIRPETARVIRAIKLTLRAFKGVAASPAERQAAIEMEQRLFDDWSPSAPTDLEQPPVLTGAAETNRAEIGGATHAS
jgi:hypothetical protein